MNRRTIEKMLPAMVVAIDIIKRLDELDAEQRRRVLAWVEAYYR